MQIFSRDVSCQEIYRTGALPPLIGRLENRYICMLYGTRHPSFSERDFRRRSHGVRRPITVIALGLLLRGVEVATGAVSLAAVRLGAGAKAVLGGDEFLVSAPRYLSGLALALGGAVLYGGLLGVELVQRHIAGGDLCPKCGTHTRRVRRRAWHRVLSRTFGGHVTRRHCERCGWSGLAT